MREFERLPTGQLVSRPKGGDEPACLWIAAFMRQERSTTQEARTRFTLGDLPTFLPPEGGVRRGCREVSARFPPHAGRKRLSEAGPRTGCREKSK